MKHPSKINVIILILFLVSHLIGLYVTSVYLNKDLPYNLERPSINVEKPLSSTMYIIIVIVVLTILLLLLIKLKLGVLWKIWFSMAILLTLSVSFSAFFHSTIAFIVAIVFVALRLFRNNVIVHNFTELFVYGAISALFAPVLSIEIASLVLIGVSAYDFIAVRKTKHMVSLAKFQAKEKLFAGFLIKYKNNMAILGGGDIAFPLIFAGVLMVDYGFLSLIISLTAMLGLLTLLFISKKKRYYPAMPFITAGCFVGYGILLLF
ncbi:MAG: presenilin family intramembrane aspartyl protease [Nanoarchaeota archaeon]